MCTDKTALTDLSKKIIGRGFVVSSTLVVGLIGRVYGSAPAHAYTADRLVIARAIFACVSRPLRARQVSEGLIVLPRADVDDLARISHRIRCIGAGILKESCYSHGFS